MHMHLLVADYQLLFLLKKDDAENLLSFHTILDLGEETHTLGALQVV